MMNTNYSYMGFLLEYREFSHFDEYATEEQVAALEARLQVKFPLAYKEIYLILGMTLAFDLGPENSYSYPDFEGMNKNAKKIAATKNVGIDVQGNDFVFCCFAETGVIWFFRLNEGDNPPIYMYEEEQDDYEQVAENLVEFVKNLGWYRGYLRVKARRARTEE